MSQSPDLLVVDDLHTHFQTPMGVAHVLNGVSLKIRPGEIVGLVGESGAGKTVLARSILNLVDPPGKVVRGRVLFNDHDLLACTEKELRAIRGHGIGLIVSSPHIHLNPVLPVGHQIANVILAHRHMSRGEALDLAISHMELVGIPNPVDTARSLPYQLSGGMAQRVIIVMSLINAPKLLIADEPTTGLDVTIQAQVLELIRERVSQSDTAVLLVTHDLGVAARMTHRLNVMYAGFLVESGRTVDLFEYPQHPYTVGLLRSVPRINQPPGEDLIAIEGAPPNQIGPVRGCPFAPRCAWRLEVCWQEMPPLEAVSVSRNAPSFDDSAKHRVACHNPVEFEEVRSGRPRRPNFSKASPSAGSAPI